MDKITVPKKRDWVYHYVSNNVPCQCCGKIEESFPEYVCDAHTHGMNKYNHLEFQVVLDYGPQETGRLLNTMGDRVRDGESFKDGDEIKGLYLDCSVFLKEVRDASNNKVLRLIIPDKENRLPEQSTAPYTWQTYDTPVLYKATSHPRS